MKKIIVIVILVLVVAAVAILAWQVINLRQEIAHVKIEKVVDGNGQILGNLMDMTSGGLTFFNQDIQKVATYHIRTGEPHAANILTAYHATDDCSGEIYTSVSHPYYVLRMGDKYYTAEGLSTIDIPIHVSSSYDFRSSSCRPENFDLKMTKVQETSPLPSFTPPLSIVVE